MLKPILEVVVVVVVLSAVWTIISGFIQTIANDANSSDAEKAIAPVIGVFILLGVAIGVIYGMLKASGADAI